MRGIASAYQDRPGTDRLVRRTLFAGFVLSGVYYFAWRTTVFSPEAPVGSVLFYTVELVGFLLSLLMLFVTGAKRVREPRMARPGIKVDVFIPTLNEDISVVRPTLVAALRMRYPHETWLLDDGNRPQFRHMAAELGCHYLTRTGTKGAKAGNLNNALRYASGELVALFDADHCAEPIFLDRLIGYFDNPAVAFVQTPQDYYNLGSFQHMGDRASGLIWHEQSGFHHVEQPGRDHHNAATLCGCSCILRRSHLDQIGGFPEETVTEDMHAAVKLHKLGNDLLGLVSLPRHRGPPSRLQKPYLRSDHFKGGGSRAAPACLLDRADDKEVAGQQIAPNADGAALVTGQIDVLQAGVRAFDNAIRIAPVGQLASLDASGHGVGHGPRGLRQARKHDERNRGDCRSELHGLSPLVSATAAPFLRRGARRRTGLPALPRSWASTCRPSSSCPGGTGTRTDRPCGP